MKEKGEEGEEGRKGDGVGTINYMMHANITTAHYSYNIKNKFYK